MALASYREGDRAAVPEVPAVTDIQPCRLVIRCLLARVDDNQWEAYSLEFGLSAQAESERDVIRKLESMIDHYLRDALLGEDREHAYELMNRKATWRVYAKYYYYLLLSHCMKPFDGRAFHAPLPLGPCQA